MVFRICLSLPDPSFSPPFSQILAPERGNGRSTLPFRSKPPWQGKAAPQMAWRRALQQWAHRPWSDSRAESSSLTPSIRNQPAGNGSPLWWSLYKCPFPLLDEGRLNHKSWRGRERTTNRGGNTVVVRDSARSSRIESQLVSISSHSLDSILINRTSPM